MPASSLLARACAIELVLRPSEALLSLVATQLQVLRDPHALTIGIHVRTGAADARGDCGGALEECEMTRQEAAADEAALAREAALK